MIMPNKYVKENEALIGFGGIILRQLSTECSMSDLWEDIKKAKAIENFERFILALDLLFLLGLIEYEGHKLKRVAL